MSGIAIPSRDGMARAWVSSNGSRSQSCGGIIEHKWETGSTEKELTGPEADIRLCLLMQGRKQKSFVAKGKDLANRQWFVVDAKDRILGRMATRIAMVLMGKHKPTYTAFLDTGDFVIVINAEKFKLSGKKRQTKTYDHYTGYPGGRRVVSLEKMMEKKPTEAVLLAYLPLSAFFVKPEPPAFSVLKVVFNVHRDDGSYAGERVDHDSDESSVSQAYDSARVN